MKKTITLAAPLAVAALIAGSGVAVASPTVASPVSATVTAASSLSAPSAIGVTPKKAAVKARAKHAKSKVVEVSLDRYRGALVWEVTVVSKTGRWEVSVDAQTGKIVRNKADDVDKRARDLKRWKAATVKYSAALKTAKALHRGSQLESIELDRENGRLVWQIELTTRTGAEYDVDVHAKTGKVVKDKLDR